MVLRTHPGRSAIAVAASVFALAAGAVAPTNPAAGHPPGDVSAPAHGAFLEAFALFQLAREDGAQIGNAIAAFETLMRQAPQEPLYLAYLGSALALKAGAAWMPWTKMKYAEQGLDHLDHALAALSPRDESRSLRGTPVALETRLVAATTFLKVPDDLFHRRAQAGRLIAQVLAYPSLTALPAGFRASIHQAAAEAARLEGKRGEEKKHLAEILSLEPAGQQAQRARLRIAEIGR